MVVTQPSPPTTWPGLWPCDLLIKAITHLLVALLSAPALKVLGTKGAPLCYILRNMVPIIISLQLLLPHSIIFLSFIIILVNIEVMYLQRGEN